MTSIFLIAWLATPLVAADWPMWRFDARRSAASPAGLPGQLHLQWTRELAPVRPAWPHEPRLQFDAAYQPIVAGERLLLASPNDGSIAAYATDTGAELWRFFADGPIRLAPVAWRDRVYFGSDDGYLYCLNAADGRLRWRVRGAPPERAEYRHLGNGRLVSFWPVRGGPVVADDVVYFGAGIWPTLGVFIHAVDAESGRILWTNTDGQALENVRIDHNNLYESGLSPQGHMLVVDEMLVVPNGRSMPARLDRATGRLHYFVQGYRNGDSRVIVSGQVALVGDSGVVSLRDGREVASRWAAAGAEAPAGWSNKKDLFEGPMFAYKFLPGCDHRSVISAGVAYGFDNGILYAHDLQRATTSTYEKEDQGRVLHPGRWQAPLLWQLDLRTSEALPAGPGGKRSWSHRCLIRAGNRLYGHLGTCLVAVELSAERTAPPVLVWTHPLDAEPASLLAADDKLFVVTADGRLHAFGGQPREPVVYARQEVAAQAAAPSPNAVNDSGSRIRKNSASTANGPNSHEFSYDQNSVNSSQKNRSQHYPSPLPELARILPATADRGGYAVVLGVADGRLVEALLAKTDMQVIAVDAQADRINRLRRALAVDGPYDQRFQAIVAAPAELELPPYLADLIVTETPQVWDWSARGTARRWTRSLRPYGGSAWLPGDEDRRQAIVAAALQLAVPGLKAEVQGQWVRIQRAGPLAGTADWTHETADAARSFFSRDERVRAPLAVLWYGDGPGYGFFKRKDYGHGVKPQVAGGRMLALQVATNTLHAVDAYTGRLLWTRAVGPSARYATFADAIYVADGRHCDVLDPRTGQPRSRFPLAIDRPAETPVSVSAIRVAGDLIVVAVRFNNENSISAGRWNSSLLVALDRADGRPLWTRQADQRFHIAAIAVGGRRVFAIDSHSPQDIAARRRRGESLDALPSTILALDARSGELLWRNVTHDPPANLRVLHFLGMRAHDDWLAYSAEQKLLLTGKANKTYAWQAETGAQVWQQPRPGNQPLIMEPETFVNQAGHRYDIRTGKLVDGQTLFSRGGCNYAVGGKHLLFVRAHCVAYVDIDSRRQYNLRNLRSGCSNSLVAADGLLNIPCFSVGCVCNYPIQTSLAMFHLPEAEAWYGTPRHQDVPVQGSGP